MENFKIYKNGKYDIKANAIYKLKTNGMKALIAIDNGFTKLYEL